VKSCSHTEPEQDGFRRLTSKSISGGEKRLKGDALTQFEPSGEGSGYLDGRGWGNLHKEQLIG